MSDARPHPHTVYLIRHGETVDNLAGVYAGVTNSALTNHGVLQGERLGQYLARQNVVFTHFYSSDLSRANRTAENIRKFQVTGDDAPAIVVCPELQEQDFGFYEGKTFYARSSPDSKKTGKDLHRAAHQNEEGFQDIETKESMAKRADSYLDEHLMSVLQAAPSDHQYVICIVSHGIMLSSLWKAILRRQLPSTVTLDQEAIIAGKPLALEHLGGFSNTGYLHLEFTKVEDAVKGPVTDTETPRGGAAISLGTQSQITGNTAQASADNAAPSDVQNFDSAAISLPAGEAEVHEGPKSTKDAKFRILVRVINGKEHLKGLKRTGGGVGSSKYDEGQKSIETFFKKRKTDS